MTYFTVKQQVYGIEKDLHDNMYRIFLERREIYRCRSNSYKGAIAKFTVNLWD